MKKKKVLFHQDNTPCHKSLVTMAKLHELGFELLPHPPSDSTADLKKMLQGKRFVSNDEVIAETYSYFGAKDKSFYTAGIEKLEKLWNECISLEEDYVNE